MKSANRSTRAVPGVRPAPIVPELITVREAADYLRVCTRTVHNLIRRGELPASHVGRQVRIDRRILVTLLGTGRTMRNRVP